MLGDPLAHGQRRDRFVGKFNLVSSFMIRWSNMLMLFIYMCLFITPIGGQLLSVIFILQYVNIMYHLLRIHTYHW